MPYNPFKKLEELKGQVDHWEKFIPGYGANLRSLFAMLEEIPIEKIKDVTQQLLIRREVLSNTNMDSQEYLTANKFYYIFKALSNLYDEM